MDKGYEKERFITLSIKESVAKRYRKFCRKHQKSLSMNLSNMMDFFHVNGLLPTDTLETNIGSVEIALKKRINSLVAIVRNIEKQQTLPTKAMLDTLFQQINQMEDENDEEDESFDFGKAKTFSRDSELELYHNRYEQIKQQLSSYHHKVQELFDQMNYVKPSFGKDHHKLNMNKNELENFKKQLNHVYHHHRSKNRS